MQAVSAPFTFSIRVNSLLAGLLARSKPFGHLKHNTNQLTIANLFCLTRNSKHADPAGIVMRCLRLVESFKSPEVFSIALRSVCVPQGKLGAISSIQ
jgi:hypothetical protein